MYREIFLTEEEVVFFSLNASDSCDFAMSGWQKAHFSCALESVARVVLAYFDVHGGVPLLRVWVGL